MNWLGTFLPIPPRLRENLLHVGAAATATSWLCPLPLLQRPMLSQLLGKGQSSISGKRRMETREESV
jgi:hypothetical protein